MHSVQCPAWHLFIHTSQILILQLLQMYPICSFRVFLVCRYVHSCGSTFTYTGNEKLVCFSFLSPSIDTSSIRLGTCWLRRKDERERIRDWGQVGVQFKIEVCEEEWASVGGGGGGGIRLVALLVRYRLWIAAKLRVSVLWAKKENLGLTSCTTFLL